MTRILPSKMNMKALLKETWMEAKSISKFVSYFKCAFELFISLNKFNITRRHLTPYRYWFPISINLAQVYFCRLSCWHRKEPCIVSILGILKAKGSKSPSFSPSSFHLSALPLYPLPFPIHPHPTHPSLSLVSLISLFSPSSFHIYTFQRSPPPCAYVPILFLSNLMERREKFRRRG